MPPAMFAIILLFSLIGMTCNGVHKAMCGSVKMAREPVWALVDLHSNLMDSDA